MCSSDVAQLTRPRFLALLAQPFPVEFCSTTKNTQVRRPSFSRAPCRLIIDTRPHTHAHAQSIIVSLVSADGTAQATSKQLTDVVKPRGEYLEKRYYERTLVLRSDETPAGQYSLVVDETYSPNVSRRDKSACLGDR